MAPNGFGIPKDGKAVPLKRSDKENVKWKVALPGPGSSSPIVVGDKIFVTSWSGYGTDEARDSDLEKLKRHLVCIDRKSGKILWDKTVNAKLPEERYSGMFTQHGYATHTPVSDGRNVYAYFGKSGLHAFDQNGKKLWEANAGSYLDRRGWGSASSPILFKGKVIVTASVEDEAVFAFDPETGKKLWRSPAAGLASTWSTPITVSKNGRDSISSPFLTKCGLTIPTVADCAGSAKPSCPIPSAAVRSKRMESFTPWGNAEAAPSQSRPVAKATSPRPLAWEGKNGSRIGTPILWENRLYWISSGIVNCRDAKTGEEIYAERIPGNATPDSSSSLGGNRGGFGGGRGRGGFGRSADYASAVAVDGHLFQITGSGKTLVVKMTKDFKFVGRNKIAEDGSRFSGTPAIDDGQFFLRSDKHLYCIAK